MLYNDFDEEITDGDGILSMCAQFYNNIFLDKDVEECNDVETVAFDDSLQELSFSDSISTCPYSDTDDVNHQSFDSPYVFLPDDSSPRLSPAEAKVMGSDLTFEEFRLTLLSIKKGKAPGLDGLTVEFYQEFFDVIGETMFNSFLHAFAKGELSTSQKCGVIKLIPKKDKNPHFVKNLRPITLLNVDVKTLSHALAFRMKDVIEKVISENQRAFIKGHNIGENILDVYALIAAAEENKEEDLLIFLDIEKAYDLVKWQFLTTVLHKLGFPPNFVRWVDILHHHKEVRFYNNGYSSEPLFPTRGLAQGCSLSPLLFIIVMDCLSAALSTNDKIQGIKYNGKEKKCGLAADDTILSIHGSLESLDELNCLLDAFYMESGLKINFTKSVIMRIGS